MALKQSVAPALEPLTLAEVKAHLRIDSGALADEITTVLTIALGNHAIAAAYSLVGTSVEVSGYNVLVNLVPGSLGSQGTGSVKLQHSQNGSTWVDVTDGAFSTITDGSPIQEKAYTGLYRYLRAVATVAGGTLDFSCEIIKQAGPTVEDTLLTNLLAAARRDCEEFQNRSYLTQTWELWRDTFPCEDDIDIPLPPLASITSIKYYDTANTEYTMTASDYFVDTKSEPGRVVLAYGKTWPSTTLRSVNAVCVTFVAGFTAAADVPAPWKAAILLLIGHLYENREATITGHSIESLPFGVEALLWKDRIL